jgi:hypothetical protein
VPYIAGTDTKAKSNTSSTWRSFNDALAAVEAGEGDGLYYALRTGSGIVGIDLDHCVTNGVIDPWAMVYVRLLNSYTCISASGTGLRILAKGTKTSDRCKLGPVECYDHDRFLSITDQHVPGTLETIEERQDELAAFMRLAFPDPKPEPKPKTAPSKPAVDLSADTLFAAAMRDRKFADLHGGTISDYPSPSEARMGYLWKAAFYARGDVALIDTWFRASSLDQTKWGSKRGTGTLGSFEIDKAVKGCSAFYDPDSGIDLAEGIAEQQAAVEKAEQIIAGASDCAEHQAALEQLRGQLDTCRKQGLEYRRQLDGVKTVLRNKHLTAGRKVVGIVAIFELARKEHQHPGESHLLYRAAIGERAGVSESAAGDALEALAGPAGIFEKKTVYKTFQQVDKQTGEIVDRRRRVSEFRPTQADPAAALRTLAAYAPEPQPDKSTWGGKRAPRCAEHPLGAVEHYESFRCKTCKKLLAGTEYVRTDQDGDLCGQVAPIETPAAGVINQNGHLDPIGVQRAQAELIRFGGLLGYPELLFGKGLGISRGEDNWRRFAEYANGTLTTALDVAAATARKQELCL